MPIIVSSAVTAMLEGGDINAVYLVEYETDAPLYLSSSWLKNDLVWDGHTWLGTGDLGSISAISQTGDLSQSQVVHKLSGIPSGYLSMALQEDLQSKKSQTYLGFLDADYNLIPDPFVVFSGNIDTLSAEGGSSASVSVVVDSKHGLFLRDSVEYATDADQQKKHPGDTYLANNSLMQEKELLL